MFATVESGLFKVATFFISTWANEQLSFGSGSKTKEEYKDISAPVSQEAATTFIQWIYINSLFIVIALKHNIIEQQTFLK